MKQLFNIYKKDKKPIYYITIFFVFVNLFWSFYSNNTWDDDCPARFQNTLHAIEDAEQFVSLWNRPLFVLIFVLPVQFGAWTIPIIQTFFSIVSGLSLYQVAKSQKFRFAYLAFPLLAFQPFVFGVSRYAMTEPLAVTLICLSLFFQNKKKWTAFAICGSLLPLARLELVIFLPLYAIALIQAKKYLSILILGTPTLLWAIAGGILNHDIFWIFEETIGKEKKENRYGHQEWHTYSSRYAYIIGPVVFLFSLLGAYKIWKSKFLRIYILLPFVLGFIVYTLFSWKLNMGNAAGFLRNIIPISPFIALFSLAGINTWFVFASKKNKNLRNFPKLKKKESLIWTKKVKDFNLKVRNNKILCVVSFSLSVFLLYVFFTNKLEMHHKKLVETYDFSLFYTAILLLTSLIIFLFLKRKLLNYLFPSCIFLFLSSYTLITEHPLANSNEERQLISKYAELYNSSYLNKKITHVNHPWFFWSTGIDRYDSQIKAMKKESLNEAKFGALALFETHYSNRLNGNVNKTYLHDSEYWVELARHSTPSENFLISTYEKVNGFENYEKSHFKFIEATNESDPTAFYCLGNTYLTKLNNLEKAYNAFAKSIHIDSTYSEGFLGLGKTMIQTKNFKNAIVFINKGLETSPKNFNLLLQKGIAQINLQHFDSAIKTLEKANKIKKSNSSSSKNKELDKFNEILKNYKKLKSREIK